jgi:glycerol uptake facilitator-like aquaporin
LLTEAWGTFILAFVIFGITNGGNKVLGPVDVAKICRRNWESRLMDV